MSTCTGCGAEITWGWLYSYANDIRPVSRWLAMNASTGKKHICPAYARECKTGYTIAPKRVEAEIDGQAALYGEGEE